MTNIFLLFFVIIGGALIPIQASINASLGKVLGAPLLAAGLSTLVSFTTFVIIIAVLRIPIPIQINSSFINIYWIFFGGGLIGAYVVFISLSAAPIIGVTTLFAGLLTGQLLVSIILDHYGLLNLQQHPINNGRIIGVILLIVGVYLIRKF